MVTRQAMPIETSSPDGVTRLLWHAMQRSEVWKCWTGFALCSTPDPILRSATNTITAARSLCFMRLPPPFLQAAVEAVPQQVEHELFLAITGVHRGNAVSQA